MTVKERTYQEFMKRFDKDEHLDNPFVVCIKMMVSALISKDGFHTALEALSICYMSENIVVYNQDFKSIASYQKYPTPLTNIVKAHVKKLNKTDFIDEFDKVFAGRQRRVLIYDVVTDKHTYYIVVLDYDILDKEFKSDVIESSRIAFYTIFDHFELIKQLKSYSDYDALTGVKSRFVYKKVSRNLTKLSPDVTFAVCDLLSLKRINDNYGHPVGDIYLKHAAKCLEKQFPKCIYKLGGDEFIIIAPGKVDIEKKMKIANDELGKIMKRTIKKTKEVFYINSGYHYGKTADISAEEFYKTADANLSEDKRHFYATHNLMERRTR